MNRTHSLSVWALVCLLFLSGTARVWSQALTVLDGLQLWLKADAGVTLNAANTVDQWDDQSGNLNHAVRVGLEDQAPTKVDSVAQVNGLPVLRFDGADDVLEVADSDSLSFAGDMSTFFVVRFADFLGYNEVWGKTSVNFPAPTDIYTSPDSGTLVVVRGNGTSTGLSFNPTAQGLPANTYLVLGFDVVGDLLTHYLSNEENGSGPTTLTTGDSDTPLRIGGRNDNFTHMKGDIAEVLIYSRALAPEERASVVAYLQTKYNPPNVPPTVTLSATPAGPNVNVGQIVTLNANANDLDGTIAKVDFIVGGTVIGTAAAPPYSLPIRVASAGSIQFTARATDNRAATATSLPLTLVGGQSGPTDLPVTGSLQLWLRADQGVTVGGAGGAIEWADQSGNVNTASAPNGDENLAPLLVSNSINGKPALQFDGTDDYLQVPDADSISITGDITTLYVLRFADFATYRAVWAKTQANLPAPTDIYTSPNGGVVQVFRGDGVGAQNIPGARAYPANTALLADWQQAGASLSHHLNGLPNGGGTVTIAPADLDGLLLIGTRADLVTRFKGEIAELLIYDRSLTASELQQVQRYLIEKYALPSFAISANTPPLVTLTSPISVLPPAPAKVPVTATASDADGSVVSVQFFGNGKLLGTDNTSPYEATLNLNFGGPVTITAIATDNLGATSSSTVTLCAQGPGTPAGLVGYWPLDGDATSVLGVDGNLVNGPVAAPDRKGTANGALSFDGALLQRVEIPGGGGLNGAQTGTISMWVKWFGPQDGSCCGPAGTVLARQSNGIFSDNIITLSTTDPDSASLQWRQNTCCAATISGVGIVGNDTWRHIAVTFTEADSELFLDGTSEGVGGGGALHSNANIALAIGAWIGDGGAYSTSTIDDVAIWNRVLSPEEILALAQQSQTPLDLSPLPDCLSIARSGATTTVRWGSAAILEQATNINGPWEEVAGATSPYTATVQGLTRFFRLRGK